MVKEQSEKIEVLEAKLGTGMLFALLGTRGTGKTQMAAELCKIAATKGIMARYNMAMEFFMELKETYRQHSERTEADVIRSYCSPQLLILDEVHERGETEWEDRLLTAMIDKRYSALKDTILISNQTPKVFCKTIGNSILSRLHETGGIVVCDWKSFRE